MSTESNQEMSTMPLPLSRVRTAGSSSSRVWDYGLHNMCLIQAVRSNATCDVAAALEGDAILEWLTPGYYKILGENTDSDSESEEDPEEARAKIRKLSEGFPGYERDYQASNGNTALHVAARLGKRETARLLLRNKWNLDVRNGRNETPIEVAELYYEDTMADWLRADQRRRRLVRGIFRIAVQLRLSLRRARGRLAIISRKENEISSRSSASAKKRIPECTESSQRTTRSRKTLRTKRRNVPRGVDLKVRAVEQGTPFVVYEDSPSVQPLDTTRVGGGSRRSTRLKRKFELS